MRCPNCRQELIQSQTEQGILWNCKGCGGRAVTLAVLRRSILQSPISHIWRVVLLDLGRHERPCPSCERHMLQVPVETAGHTFQIDVCKGCEFFWFDAHKYEEMPLAPKPEPVGASEAGLSQAAREALAIRRVEQMGPAPVDAENVPEEWWQRVACTFGLPAEYNNPTQTAAWVTWSLAVLMVIASGWSFLNFRPAVEGFGLIPNAVWRSSGLTWVTAFFVHGNVTQLVGNLYFLLVFGDNVEEALGRGRFLLLILAATLMGGAIAVLEHSGSPVPCIGSSGGISGVIIFYALQFPKVQFGIHWPRPTCGSFRYRWMIFPAKWIFIFWLGEQFVFAFISPVGFAKVTSMSQLGGALAGLIFWLCVRKRSAGAEAVTN